MNRAVGIARSRAGRVGLVASVALATVVGLALPAGANTGHVLASQTCQRWSVSVTLDNNASVDHFVEVTTTIPGTTGIVDGHFNTTGNSGTTQIWDANGPAPSSGTVTLTILNPDRSVDSTASASLPEVNGCENTTTTTTQPNTTTTIRESGSTSLVTNTTVSETTATLGAQGGTVTTTTAGPSAATAPGSLPLTGSGTAFPVIFAISSIAAGALLLLRKRSAM